MLLASVDASTTRHFDLDHLGMPRLITGSGGTTLAIHDYYPFGMEAYGTADGERMKFTGHERDLMGTPSQTDDLDNMHARFYNPNLARFISTDLLRGDPHSPQSFNLFAYVQGNPVDRFDPLGLAPGDTHQTVNVIGDDPCPEVPQGWSCAQWYAFGPGSVGPTSGQSGPVGIFGSGGGGVGTGPTGPQQQSQPCGLYGGGLGVSLNANVDDVLGPVGLNGTLSAGWGAFYDLNNGLSNGGFASGAALMYSGNNVLATPPQTLGGNTVSPGYLGAYAGAGLSFFGTNAHSAQQLGGHFVVYQGNVGLGVAKASMSLALGNGVAVFSASVVPLTGTGIGVSGTRYVTDTTTTNTGCH
jgi:RHS repeat-associated protein